MTCKRGKLKYLKEIIALLRSNDLLIDGVAENIDNFLVLQEGKEVVGCIGVEIYGDDGLLRSAAVRRDRQGQGLGSILANDLIGFAKRLKLKRLYLLTATAARFFSKFGFIEVSRQTLDSPVLEAPEFTTICCCSTPVLMRVIDR